MSTWTTPTTFVSAATLTAAQLNGTRDNLLFLKGALDLLTGSTTADTGTAMSISLVVATAASSALRARVTGDAEPQFILRGDGQLQWGTSTSSVTRVLADPVPASQQIVWRGYDGAGTQSTVTSIVEVPSTPAASSVSGVWLNGDAFPRIAMGTNASGAGRLGFTVGSSSTSANLWRSNTGTLGTTDTFEAQIFDAKGMGDGIIRSSGDLGFYVSGTKVLGSQKTGWGTMTGTGARTGIDLEAATTAQIGNRLKALIDDLKSHGLLNS